MVENTYLHNGLKTFTLPMAVSGAVTRRRPTLENILKEFDPIPARSLLLGLCEDGLPLILDLTDPSPGSFLIVGDDAQSNFNLLYSLLTSSFLVNTAEEVNLHLISPLADELVELYKQPAFKISFAPTRLECEIVVEEMVNLVHRRQSTMEIHPIHVLTIDGLDLLFRSLSPEAIYWFNWLAEKGPEVGLWVIAAVESRNTMNLPDNALDGFLSRIIGHIQSPQIMRNLSGLRPNHLESLVPGEQFYVHSVNGSRIMWQLQSERQMAYRCKGGKK